jgi:AcrR family transcriptional regulator
VIEAAAVAFAERGWAATTMPLIARRAEVAVETVYRAVPGGKAALLAAAVQATLAGGAARAEIATDDRPGIRRVLDAPDPREALRQYARSLTGTWKRVGPLLVALDRAGSDPELARLSEDLERQRLDGMRRFARHLDAGGHLRRGLTVDRAADVLWTICSRANHDDLTIVRGWSDEEYAEWVLQALAALLLDPG